MNLSREPNLHDLIAVGSIFSWGDKKNSCISEARSMWSSGQYSLSDNPFVDGTWPHKWWHDEYTECSAPAANDYHHLNNN